MQIKDNDKIVEVSNLTTDELWDMIALFTTELSRRDRVQYRVSATPESVKSRIDSMQYYVSMAQEKLQNLKS